MRVWHPDLVSVLDDERLTAAHTEVHTMVGAIARQRAAVRAAVEAVRDARDDAACDDDARDDDAPLEPPRVPYFGHPETLAFATEPGHLAWVHDVVVVECARRGFPGGLAHATPVRSEDSSPEFASPEFAPRVSAPPPSLAPIPLGPGWRSPLAGAGVKPSWEAWRERDLFDLAGKWAAEGRITESGVLLGRRVSCKPRYDAGAMAREDCDLCFPRWRRHRPVAASWAVPEAVAPWVTPAALAALCEAVRASEEATSPAPAKPARGGRASAEPGPVRGAARHDRAAVKAYAAAVCAAWATDLRQRSL